MDVSSQHHAPADLHPTGHNSRTYRIGSWVDSLDKRKISFPSWDSKPVSSSQKTDYNIPAPTTKCSLSSYFFTVYRGFNFRHAVKSRFSHIRPLDPLLYTDEGNPHFLCLPSVFVSKSLSFYM